MGTVKPAKNLEKRRTALTKLNEQREAARGELAELQTRRGAAVKALAKGDHAQTRVVRDLDAEISTLSLRIEGLDGLVADALDEIQKATAELNQAAAEEQAALDAFIAARKDEEQALALASLPERLERIAEHLTAASLEMGEIQLGMYRWPFDNQFVNVCNGWNFRVSQLIEKQQAGVLRIFPDIMNTTIGSFVRPLGKFQPGLAYDRGEVVREIMRADIERWTEEFHRTRGE